MQRFEYAVSVIEVAGRFTVQCRDFPHLGAAGDDLAAALRQADVAIETVFSACLQAGQKLPIPSAPLQGELLIAPTAETMAKAALRVAMRDAGITRVQLAKRLAVDEKEVRRMLDPRCKSKLPRIAQAIGMLGRKLVIRLELA